VRPPLPTHQGLDLAEDQRRLSAVSPASGCGYHGSIQPKARESKRGSAELVDLDVEWRYLGMHRSGYHSLRDMRLLACLSPLGLSAIQLL
jgi:hypothetical protein